MIDDYINLKTLSPMREVAEGVKIMIISSNTYGYLKKNEVEDNRREFPNKEVPMSTPQKKAFLSSVYPTMTFSL